MTSYIMHIERKGEETLEFNKVYQHEIKGGNILYIASSDYEFYYALGDRDLVEIREEEY